MNEIITSSDIYWITRLDTLHESVGVIACVSMVVALVIHMIASIERSIEKTAVGNWNAAIHIANRLLCISIISGIIIIFLPTTKEAIAMKGIPMILNNEKVQQAAVDSVDGAAEIIKAAKECFVEELKEKSETKK